MYSIHNIKDKTTIYKGKWQPGKAQIEVLTVLFNDYVQRENKRITEQKTDEKRVQKSTL